MNLLNVALAVVPDDAAAIVLFAFAPMNDIRSEAFDPPVPLVVLKIKVSRNVSLDEECAYPGLGLEERRSRAGKNSLRVEDNGNRTSD